MGTYNPNEHPLITVVTSSSPLGKKYPKNNSLICQHFIRQKIYNLTNHFQT